MKKCIFPFTSTSIRQYNMHNSVSRTNANRSCWNKKKKPKNKKTSRSLYPEFPFSYMFSERNSLFFNPARTIKLSPFYYFEWLRARVYVYAYKCTCTCTCTFPRFRGTRTRGKRRTNGTRKKPAREQKSPARIRKLCNRKWRHIKNGAFAAAQWSFWSCGLPKAPSSRVVCAFARDLNLFASFARVLKDKCIWSEIIEFWRSRVALSQFCMRRNEVLFNFYGKNCVASWSFVTFAMLICVYCFVNIFCRVLKMRNFITL